MPYLETPSDLAEEIADWVGVYGSCKSDGYKGCQISNKLDCCRVGFIEEVEKRIRESVSNETLLLSIKSGNCIQTFKNEK